ISSYTRDKNFLVRITGTDLSNRDISGAKESFSELAEFLTRFPESQYGPYAKQRSIYLRNMIARNELAAADYYITRKAYVASIRRANYVLENIPGSSENLRALKILLVSYDALGYSELYEDTKKVIALNFKNVEEPEDESSWFWTNVEKTKPE
ncbi:outer membrane protein assembly factor BamD, partial [Gammaproteobacteria bacterium]|nr:outer membrane protein assembly factor BamD [Gammaproteobacteria bacterium]